MDGPASDARGKKAAATSNFVVPPSTAKDRPVQWQPVNVGGGIGYARCYTLRQSVSHWKVRGFLAQILVKMKLYFHSIWAFQADLP